MEHRESVGPDDLLGCDPEHPLDRRAGVAHQTVRPDDRDQVGRVLHQRAEARFVGPQGRRHLVGLASQSSPVERGPDRLAQPAETIFEQEVGRAVAHGRGGRLLADGAGDDDERDVVATIAKKPQCVRRLELRETEIGEDDVKIGAERGEEFVLALDARSGRIEAGATQRVQR